MQALQLEAGVFAANYNDVVAKQDDYWRYRLSNEHEAFFGLYFQGVIVGLCGIMLDPDNREQGELIASYIMSAHRCKGLSQLFYEARIDWARRKGVKRLVISHRESNISSGKANQAFGFQFTHSVSRLWNDGCWENNVYYELML